MAGNIVSFEVMEMLMHTTYLDHSTGLTPWSVNSRVCSPSTSTRSEISARKCKRWNYIDWYLYNIVYVTDLVRRSRRRCVVKETRTELEDCGLQSHNMP